MDKPVLIIAEAGNLHNGDFEKAKSFIKEVSEAGADAVKFQTHIFNEESLPDAPNPDYFQNESRKSYFERTEFSPDQWHSLKEYAENECSVEFMSSVFSDKAVDILDSIGVKRYKIPSGEVTNIPLLEKIAGLNKPVLLSSGMSTWAELDGAVKALKDNGAGDITILQCTSMYPCSPDLAGLYILEKMKARYRLPVGFSDHTLGFAASIAAVAMGSIVIEKHFTLSRNIYGSDAKHSLEPDEFKRFVKEIRDLERMLSNKIDKDKVVGRLGNIKVVFEKSIVARRFIPKGKNIVIEDLAFKKPGDGVKPVEYKQILGRKAAVDIQPDIQIRKEMIE